ncbi:hypothetical protein COE51_20565 [Bacillus pseudomycoides]|nr:hypothetical protein COE51_20565 [Bacillus pseudomycoides]
MTLSKRIIKKWLLPFILCFSMVFAFFPQNSAFAYNGTRNCGGGFCYFHSGNISNEIVLTFTYEKPNSGDKNEARYINGYVNHSPDRNAYIRYDIIPVGQTRPVVTHTWKQGLLDRDFYWFLTKDNLVHGKKYNLRVTTSNANDFEWAIQYGSW